MRARIAAAFLLAGCLGAQDAPSRVGRLSFLYGPVSYRPGSTQDWGDAVLNLPLSDGDHLWTDANGQAEVQAGAAVVHLAPQTGFSVVRLDDRVAQLAVSEGAVNLRIARMNQDERVEVATPTGTFRLLRPGNYRIDVVPVGGYTSIAVRSGAAEVVAGPQTAPVAPGQRLVLAGNPASLEFVDMPAADLWDEWCADRDAAFERGVELSEAYVDWELPGVDDLAANGDWETDSDVGTYWSPAAVGSDWTPFHNGRWIYKLPWGWTWVDAAAWGFAPSHFGRWAKVKHGWGWIPGHRHQKEPYSPATVAFTPGAGRVVSWAPLAPGETVASGARRNREAASSAEVAAFRTSRPIGPGRLSDVPAGFTARTPNVEPAPEAIFGGRMHPSKPPVEARTITPPAAPAPLPRTAPVERVAVEDHRSSVQSYSPDPTPMPAPAPVQSAPADEPRHSDPAPESRHTDDSPPQPHHNPAPQSSPPPVQHTETHSTVQEHRAETPHVSEAPRSSPTSSSGSRK